MKRTTYINGEGKTIKYHTGEPRKIEVFKKCSEHAVRIDISESIGQGFLTRHFFKLAGRWVSEIFKGENGWMRQVLVANQSLMSCITESLSQEEADEIINDESIRVLPYALESIRWCDQKDVEDKDGRYWLNAYSGAGVYRLIVQDGKIIGSIYGGFHGSRHVICSQEAWALSLRKAIEKRVSGDYKLLKADGSGTYFYLRNIEDSQYLKTESYYVPSTDGGCHLNLEAKKQSMR